MFAFFSQVISSVFLFSRIVHNLTLLGQAVLHGVGFGQIAIYIVVIAAVIALVYVALNKFGIPIPDWVKQVFWIVVVAVVVILAIRFVISM